MTGPWYVKEAWDRTYLMRHDLNPSAAQSECDRLNAEWEQAQVPVKVEMPQDVPQVVDDPLVVQPLENADYGWCVMACGKYAARCTSEAHGCQIANRIRANKDASGVYWTTPESANKAIPWQTVQADLDAAWAATKPVTMVIIDEDVKPPGEPTITVESIDNDDYECWAVVVNGKYYAPFGDLAPAEDAAKKVKSTRSYAGFGWCDRHSHEEVGHLLVNAEWSKLPVKEDIKTVEVNQDKYGNWRAVLNGKWEARCGRSKETADAVERDTLKGNPNGWTWRCLETGNMIHDLRPLLNLKG